MAEEAPGWTLGNVNTGWGGDFGQRLGLGFSPHGTDIGWPQGVNLYPLPTAVGLTDGLGAQLIDGLGNVLIGGV